MRRDMSKKEPLYRKVNTKARGVRHRSGGDYRHVRNTKRADEDRGSMHGKHRRGLDYTPLFRFLLSKAGEAWDDVFREASARLDRTDPIFWIVARSVEQRRDVVRVGESTYYSGLFVDDDGTLQRVAPDFGPGDLDPPCRCCTYALNGKPVPRRAAEE